VPISLQHNYEVSDLLTELLHYLITPYVCYTYSHELLFPYFFSPLTYTSHFIRPLYLHHLSMFPSKLP